MARGSAAAGTMAGSSAAMVGRSKAWVAPSSVTATKMPAMPSQPCQTPSSTSSRVTASTTWQTKPMRRRSNWSATWPTTKVSTTMGRNWQSPMRPRSNGLRVWS